MISGWTLALFASLSFVILDVLRKFLGRSYTATDIVIGINLGAGISLGALLTWRGLPEFDGLFVTLALLEGLTFTFSSILYVRAVSLSPLSLTIPYLGFTPVFSGIVAAILLGEWPSGRGWLGIVLVVLGGVSLHLGRRLSILDLLKAPLQEPGSWRMLLVALIWGVTTSIDKIAIGHGSELLLGFAISFTSALFLIAYRLATHSRHTVRPPIGEPLLYAAGLVAGFAVLCQYFAYRELLVAYVETVKRAGGLLSVVLGALFFEEADLLHRLPAAGLMVVGILLIAL